MGGGRERRVNLSATFGTVDAQGFPWNSPRCDRRPVGNPRTSDPDRIEKRVPSSDRQTELDPAALIEELKTYIGFTAEDADRLRSFAPHLLARRWDLSQAFYDFILRNDSVRDLIERSGADIGGLRRTWEQWAEQLVGGEYHAEYAVSRLKIGAVHLRIGVEERYTVATFNIVRQFLHDLIHESTDPDPQKRRLLVGSLNRALDLDLSLICHAYDYALHAETVAEQSEARRSLEELLGSLLAAPSLLILSIDDSRRIVHFNRGCETLLRITAHEVIGRDYIETLVPRANRVAVQADIDRVFREPPRPNGTHSFTPHRLRVSGGGECVVTWYPTIVPGADGGVKEYLWVGHDTTEEHRLQGQIVHQEKMAAVGLLAAGVAHEIGNPLASISSVAQTAHRKSDDPYVRGKLELVRTHIDRIATIVRRMVDFARPPRYEWHSCSVNDLVRNAAQFLEYDKRAKCVSIELDLSEELPTTVGMEDQLTQVFLNLILNALDAVEGVPAELTPRLCVSTRLDNESRAPEIVFRCEDNGPGIEAPAIRRIFEPFFTTKEVGRGTGLGLSVSFRIIEDHGGRIDVDSRPGEGARFEVRIPVREAPPTSEEAR